MSNQFHGFRAGDLEDDDTRRSQLVRRSALVLAALVAVSLLNRELATPMPRLAFWVNALVVPLLCFVPLLLRWGATATAAAILPLVAVLVPALLAYEQAGLATPGLFALPLAPLTGTFFGGARVGLAATAAALGAVIALAALHLTGHAFPGMRMDDVALARSSSVTFVVVVAMASAIAYLYEAQRRRREALLQESQRRYALAAEGSLDGLYENDLVTGRATYSARFKWLLGYDEDVALDLPLSELLHPDDRDALLGELGAPAPTVDRDVRLRCANGESRWFQLRGALWHPNSDQARLAGSIRDISARKLTEQLKDEFVATVSHELRTPLTSMRGALRLLQHGAAGPIPEAAGALLDAACRNTDRLRTLVEDLLDFQSIESGHLRLSCTNVDVAAVLQESIDLNRGFAEVHGVRLSLRLGEGLPLVHADAGRLQQVVTNLLSNACKFAPAESSVEVSAQLDDSQLSVCVTDSGPGVPPEFESMLFSKFSQADAGASRKHPGTGLGLAICRGIVLAHAGQIGYRRRDDKTIFEVRLPCCALSTRPGHRAPDSNNEHVAEAV